ncbi:MAG: hypothetical protein AMXMBFR13_38910 [Phycisphaerae bacterium]
MAALGHPCLSTLRWAFRQYRLTKSVESETFNVEFGPARRQVDLDQYRSVGCRPDHRHPGNGGRMAAGYGAGSAGHHEPVATTPPRDDDLPDVRGFDHLAPLPGA